MNRSGLCRGFLISAGLALSLTAASSVRAGDMVDDPKYLAWKNFKIGSNATVAADLDAHGQKIHLQMTRTLISIDADKAVIETKSTATMMGTDRTAPARQETIPAKTDKEVPKLTGEKEIEAMNKSFKCKVYETTGNADAKPDKGLPSPDSMKATVYASDDVPGGLVRLEAVRADGKELTFILTGMESK